MNNVTLAGRLTADPELRTLESGTEVCSFTLACDRRFKDASGNKQTDFIYCKAWSKTAVFISTYFHKGDGLTLAGRIETRRYEDKNNNTRTAFEVVAENVEFALGKRRDAPVTNGAIPQPNFGFPVPPSAQALQGQEAPAAFSGSVDGAQASFDEMVDDDLPF